MFFLKPENLFYVFFFCFFFLPNLKVTGSRSAVSYVSDYRCISDCRSRGREFDFGPVSYYRRDWSWNNFCGNSPHFIQEVLISVRTLISVWTIACKNTFHKAWFTTKWCVSSVGVKSWIYGPCSLYPNHFDDLGWVVSSPMVSFTHKETRLIFKHGFWTR